MELRAPSYPHFHILLEDQTRRARLEVVCTLRPLGWYLTAEVPAEWLGCYRMRGGVAVAAALDAHADPALLKAVVESLQGAPTSLTGAWSEVTLRWEEPGFLSSRRVTARLLSRVSRPDWRTR